MAHILALSILRQTGYPNKFENGFGFNVGEENNCRRCQEGGPQNCGLHRQSPIDLKRDRGIIGHQFEKECPDWHWMQYRDDSCSWEDMEDQFEIERHSLKINIPVRPNGDIDCVREDGQRRFPRLDYSKGFPDWWWMDHMSITTPSNHIQEGTQYAAEVILAHFYQIAHPKNQVRRQLAWAGHHLTMRRSPNLTTKYSNAAWTRSFVPG